MHDFIKQTALSVGFDDCGIARAEALTDDAVFLRTWLDAGMQGDMSYLVRNFEKRIDPRMLVPGCKSVVVVLLNYFPEQKQAEGLPKIAKYAYSKIDYHRVMKKKLQNLENTIVAKYGESCINKDHQHSFSDSAPVLEKRWAEKAGLGWLGRHTQLIHPKLGSTVFIGILLLNVAVKPSEAPFPFRCGTCTKCIDACPTNALTGDGHMDPRKCISYHTLESKSSIPREIRDKLSGYIVGCDICNDVCPWNKRFAHPHKHGELVPSKEIFHWTHEDWASISQETFNRIFNDSAIKRAKLTKIKQNL